MAGVTVSGVLWAIFQNNAGGAWDNAKKSFEAGVEINGVMTYKGSEAHKAAVTGDTVGDPFKDTSGPSMNILIKLTCLIGLVIAPILGGHSDAKPHAHEVKKEIRIEGIEVESNTDEIAKATITTTSVENGVETIKEEIFEGTLEEVKAKVNTLKGEGVHGKLHLEVDETKSETKKMVKVEVQSNI
jgi:K(+)-stimulated pyrophosphate-energized sodium pump